MDRVDRLRAYGRDVEIAETFDGRHHHREWVQPIVTFQFTAVDALSPVLDQIQVAHSELWFDAAYGPWLLAQQEDT